MMCVECSRPVDPRTGYCTACGVWSLDLAASGAMPRFTQNASQPAPQAARTTMPTIPEWGPAEPAEAEWDLPPAPVAERLAYEAPPTGFESAPPPMAPRAYEAPVAAPEPLPTPPVDSAPPLSAPPFSTPQFSTPQFSTPAPAAPPVAAPAATPEGPSAAAPTQPAAFAHNETLPTPTLDDLFSQPSHMPAPAAPGAALPFAFLPPPRAADRTEVAQPAKDALLEPDFEDPELTMIASRRGKTKFWTLDLPDGSVEVIVGSVIVGRAATPVPGRVGARLLSIDDPTRSVSKNHAIFTDDNGTLYVEDLESMNGIVVTRVDGHESEAVPGVRQRLDHGSTVELGDLLLTVYKN